MKQLKVPNLNKQKTLLITFLVYQRTKSQKKTASLFFVKLVLTKTNKPLANVEDAQENRGEEERDADGLTAEILETSSGRRSPVNEWLVRACYEIRYCQRAEQVHKKTVR